MKHWVLSRCIGVRSSSSFAALANSEIDNVLSSDRFSDFWGTIKKILSRNLPKVNSFGARFKNNVVLDRKQRLKWLSVKLHSCAVGGSVKKGKAIHGQIYRSGIVLDSHLWVSLINFYAKCSCLGCARRVLDEMSKRDVVSWTALISGYVSQGYAYNGCSLLCEMQKEGIRPNKFTLSTVLKACIMGVDMELGEQLHGEVIKVGVFSDIYVGSCLVDLYAKCGDLESAAKVFCSMPEKNAVSWNALLNGYAEMGDSQETLRLFCSIVEPEMKFNKYTLSTVVKGCANSGDLGVGRFLHCIAIKIGCESGEFLSCSLVDMYSKFGLADDALVVFLNIECPDIFTWSAIIGCLSQHGRNYEAAGLFRSMKCAGLKPNEYTLASLMKAASKVGVLYCKSIHAYVYKHGFESDNAVSNAMITMYLVLGYFDDGYQVFNAMNHRDVLSWNSLLSGFHNSGTSDQGIPIFKQMLVEGFMPSRSTYISAVGLCSSLSDINIGRQVHAHIVKDNLIGDNRIETTLIDMYAKCISMVDAEVIFNRLYHRDLVSWTAMIAGYSQNGEMEKAIRYFIQMQKEGLKPNEFTLSSCLKASRSTCLLDGRQLHSFAIKSGNLGDKVVASAIVDMYGKSSCIDEAELIFNGMDSHDTVSWNTIICEYVQHGQGEKALEAFENMLEECVLPDGATFSGILSACSYMGLIDEGWKYFDLMTEVCGIKPSIEHYTCMVKLLASSGRLDEVEQFIEQMNVPPNALIHLLSQTRLMRLNG